MRRKWRWLPVTALSLIVMLCGHHGGNEPTAPKNQPGHLRSHHHHSTRSAPPSA